MKKIPILLLLALCLLSFSACSQSEAVEAPPPAERQSEPPAAGETVAATPLSIVTTIFPPYDFVREIAGDTVELTMLLPPGSESHSFEPTPQDIITIQNCDIFIYVGGDSDDWVDRILDSMDTGNMTVIALLEIVEPVAEEYVEGMQGGHSHDDEDDHDHDHDDEDEHDHDHDHDDDDVELDEHVWTSPKNAITIVNALTETLSRLDAANSALYTENGQRYSQELAALDAEFASIVAEANRKTIVFADRFPFRYLADAYGLDYFAAFPGCSTDSEASAATVAFLIDKVSDEAIPVVFFIEFSNERMADTICEATGAEKRLLHSCHNITRDDFRAGQTYLEIMWQNTVNLKEALL